MMMPAFLSPTALPQRHRVATALTSLRAGRLVWVLTYLECARRPALSRRADLAGSWLEARELAILETVTSKAE